MKPQEQLPSSPEVTELRRASANLEYPSESDTPFDLFTWPGNASAKPGAPAAATAQAQVAARAGGRKVDEVAVDAFFKQLDDSDDAERFRQLRHALEARLAGLKIFRVGDGETNVDIYLIGKTHSGDWAGLHTISVET